MPDETHVAPFRIGVVADDLTGALDAGAGFANAGMRVRVPLHPVDRALDTSGVDAIVVNTASRHGSASDAHERTRVATIALLRAGVTLLYKKVDSVLRGHPGPELAGMLSPLPPGTRALVAPAFPAQGRVTTGGVQMINGRPVDSFGGRLRDAFANVATACDFHDAADEDDLHAIAKQGVDDGVRVWVGSAGLAAELVPALVEKGLHFTGYGEAEEDTREQWHGGSPVVVVAGSIHPMTVAQVAEVAAHGVAHLAMDPQRPDTWPNLDALDAPLVVSTHAAVPDGMPSVAWMTGTATLLDRIADGLRRRLETGAPLALVVTGGETAQTLFARLGATAIVVTGEVLPGVPTGLLHVDGCEIKIVTKSGGFGTASDLATIIASTIHSSA